VIRSPHDRPYRCLRIRKNLASRMVSLPWSPLELQGGRGEGEGGKAEDTSVGKTR
jgi:uncharacterized protein (DUF1015 family)